MSTEERIERLEKKLARLKRRDRWLPAVILLAAGAWIAFAGFGRMTSKAGALTEAQGHKTVRANAFILLDKNDKERASLAMTKMGPALTLYDEKGKTRALLVATRMIGPALRLYDEKGKTRVSMDVRYGEQALWFYDEKGERGWCAPGGRK